MSKSAAQPAILKEFPGQHPDEQVVLVFRQHPVVLRRPLIYGLLAILVVILPLDFILSGPLYSFLLKAVIVVPLLVLMYWFYHWVGWFYSVYIVTSQRLINIRQKGFFNREVSEVGFDKIQSINYHIKGIQAALLKFGDITVQTYTSDWVLKSVHHPEEVHSQIMTVAHGIVSTPPQK
ncbi:MAG TPA: PH domain-containing protein [Candidatus Saccharimonadales bacterium]|jgi:uncharacterized membrane protein YdbT with pleckstrin-like domain|nr:PH domain-containing protein [Candidatus Saccharimonadales bacterium]